MSAAFFAGGLALSAVYATTGLGVACPFRALTGWDCPLCGGTRMGAALLHGDLVVAFLANPLALIGLVVLGLLGRRLDDRGGRRAGDPGAANDQQPAQKTAADRLGDGRPWSLSSATRLARNLI